VRVRKALNIWQSRFASQIKSGRARARAKPGAYSAAGIHGYAAPETGISTDVLRPEMLAESVFKTARISRNSEFYNTLAATQEARGGRRRQNAAMEP